MTQNGISTTTELGQEKYECRYNERKDTEHFYCDYRHTDGELFSCVKPTLQDCRAARDTWLERKVA